MRGAARARCPGIGGLRPPPVEPKLLIHINTRLPSMCSNLLMLRSNPFREIGMVSYGPLAKATWVLLVTLALTLAGCGDDATMLRVGDPMHSFSARTLTGETIDLPDACAGKVLVLRFWASWCPFCRDEMRAVETIWKDDRARGLLVVAVNVGQGTGQVESFIKDIAVSYPVLLDPGSKISRAYHVTGLPTTFVIDRQGRIRGRILGEASEATLRQAVEALL